MFTPSKELATPWYDSSSGGDLDHSLHPTRASTSAVLLYVLLVPILQLGRVEQVYDLGRHAQHLHQQK